MNIVIGSGPSGVSCAQALLDRGENVLMIDAGVGKGEEINSLLGQVTIGPSQSLSSELKNRLSIGDARNSRGFPIKLSYGSDFPYRGMENFFPLSLEKCELSGSFAEGGLSNVWGASVLPYVQNDIQDWPITIADLAPFYERVLEFMNLAGVQDSLSEVFPLYTAPKNKMEMSRQANAFLSDLKKGESQLKKAGVFFGQSRVAVGRGCTYCGLCLTGCPHQIIYSSAHTLNDQKKRAGFEYRNDLILKQFEEKSGHVRLYFQKLSDRKEVIMEADRAYLACGTIVSSAIVLNSLKRYNKPITLLDSHYFLFPFISKTGFGKVDKESLYTLSQVFVEVMDRHISEKTVHMQVYSYSEYFVRAIKGYLKGGASILSPVTNVFLGRLLLFQGFLHSDDSPSIDFQISPSGDYSEPTKIFMKPRANPRTKKIVKEIFKKLTRLSSSMGGFSIGPFAQSTEPGRSFHSGGTFPMSLHPGEYESDILGRPFKLKRVHVVDSSVLPSIPATTITLSVMANAYRIGATNLMDER